MGGLIWGLHREVLLRSLKLLPPLAFSPKWGSHLGQTIASPWTLIQCTLFCRGGRNGATSGSSTPLWQNAAVCGGLYGLSCLQDPSPSLRCWMRAPWLSLGSFAPKKWGEEGQGKERGSRGRGGGESSEWHHNITMLSWQTQLDLQQWSV